MAETRRLVFRIEDETPPDTLKNIRKIRQEMQKLDKALPKAENMRNFTQALFDIEQAGRRAGKGLQSTVDEVNTLNKRAKPTRKTVGQVEDALGKVGVASRKAAKDTKGFNAVLAGLSAGGAAQALGQIVRLFGGVGNGIKGLIQSANQEFGSFDAALVEFSQKSGVARDDLGSLGEEANRLAAITSQTPASVAELSAALLALGTPVDQVEGSLSGVVKLADVINEDPVLTGKVLQTGVNIFGEFGETTDTIADKISKLINTTAAGSTGGVQEFFQLYQQAGPVAVEAGIGFDELATSFATLRDAGVSARVGATGLRNTILNLAAPSDKARAILGQLGVEVFEVGENGQEQFVGLEEAVRRFGQSIEGLSEEEQIFAAERIFGKGNIAPVFALLNQLDGRFQETANNVANSAGEVDRALEVINEGARRQAELLAGKWAAALTLLGGALNNTGVAGIQFLSDLLEATQEGSEGLGDLTDAGQRLRDALASNPEVVQQLGAALGQIGDLIVDVVAGGLDRLSSLINNVSDRDLQNFTERLVETAEEGLRVAGAIGELLLSVGQLGAGVGTGAVDAFNSLAPAIAGIITFLADVVQILQPLVSNTELLSAAMQVLFIRMVAIKGIALAGTLKALIGQLIATTAASGGASASLGTFATAATAAAAPLAALAAAIAATKFIKYTRDLKVANDALEAYTNGTSTAADTAFNLANSINNINRAIEDQGGEATDEQIRKLEGYRNIASQQLEDLQRQLQEVQSFEPQSDEQVRSQEYLISQINTSIKALEGQIDKADAQLTGAAAGLGEETGQAFTDGLESTAEGGANTLAGATDELEAAKEALEEAFADSERSIGRQAEDDALARREQQEETLAAKREENEAKLQDIREAGEAELEQRKEAHQEKLNSLQEQVDDQVEARQLQQQRTLAEAEKQVAAEIAAFEQAEQDKIEAKQEAFQAGQQASARNFQRAQQAAAAAFQEEQQRKRERNSRELSVLEREVQRRLQLEQAGSKAERRDLEAQFEAEDEEFALEREIEQDVVRGRRGILSEAEREGRLEDSPLEALAAEKDAELQQEAEDFQKGQQESAQLFQEAQQEEAKRFEEEVIQPLKEELQAELDAKKAQAEEEVLFPLRQRLEDELAAYKAELETSIIKPVREQQEAEIAEIKKQNEAELFEIKKQQEAELKTLQKEFDDNERAISRQLEDERLARERAHKEELAALENGNQEAQHEADIANEQDLNAMRAASAQEMKNILESTRIPPVQVESVPGRRYGGDVQPGKTYEVGEVGAELFRTASGKEMLVGQSGPQYFSPSTAGRIVTAGETKRLMQARLKAGMGAGGTGLAVNAYTGEISNGEVIKRLDALIKVAVKNGAPKLSPVYNFPPSSDPYGAAAEASFATLRQMVKGAGL